MIRFSPPTLLKFLAGVLLVQAATAIQVVAALSSEGAISWILFALLSVTAGVFAALWFASIAQHRSRETLFHAQERFSRERERMHQQSAREQGHTLGRFGARVARANQSTSSLASIKAGATIAGLLGVCSLLLMSQLFSLALMALTTAGAGLAGYAFGRFQDGRPRRERVTTHLGRKAAPPQVIEAEQAPHSLPTLREGS